MPTITESTPLLLHQPLTGPFCPDLSELHLALLPKTRFLINGHDDAFTSYAGNLLSLLFGYFVQRRIITCEIRFEQSTLLGLLPFHRFRYTFAPGSSLPAGAIPFSWLEETILSAIRDGSGQTAEGLVAALLEDLIGPGRYPSAGKQLVHQVLRHQSTIPFFAETNLLFEERLVIQLPERPLPPAYTTITEAIAAGAAVNPTFARFIKRMHQIIQDALARKTTPSSDFGIA